MEYDYRKLRGKIIEVFGSQTKFAKALGVSDRTVSLKLNNERGWTQEEINKSMTLFDGRILAAAPIRPVSSSDANSTFSISCSGSTSETSP